MNSEFCFIEHKTPTPISDNMGKYQIFAYSELLWMKYHFLKNYLFILELF